MTEPFVKHAAVRLTDDDIHIECTMDDGHQFVLITVSKGFEKLASVLAGFLNLSAELRCDLEKKHECRIEVIPISPDDLSSTARDIANTLRWLPVFMPVEDRTGVLAKPIFKAAGERARIRSMIGRLEKILEHKDDLPPF